MRKIFRARHADPRGAVPRVSDRRRRRSPQARPAPRRNDRELIPSLPCRSSLRVCRSRSATVEDLAASNSSGASVRFYLLSGGLPTISCGGWSCRIGDHRRCLNVLAAPRDDVHPGISETSRRDPVRCRGSSTGGGPQAATPQQPAMPPRVNPGSSAVMNAAHYPGVEPCSMAGRQT